MTVSTSRSRSSSGPARRDCRSAQATRSGSALEVAPETPARLGGGRGWSRVRSRSGLRFGDGRRSSSGHARTRRDLHEFESPNGRSILDRCGRGGRAARGPGRRDLGDVGSGLPAGPDLVSPEWPPLTIEPAEAHLGGDGPTEVATGGAGGARTAADPASRRLCLGRPAVWTAPYRHARMVAANDPAVDSPRTPT